MVCDGSTDCASGRNDGPTLAFSPGGGRGHPPVLFFLPIYSSIIIWGPRALHMEHGWVVRLFVFPEK